LVKGGCREKYQICQEWAFDEVIKIWQVAIPLEAYQI